VIALVHHWCPLLRSGAVFDSIDLASRPAMLSVTCCGAKDDRPHPATPADTVTCPNCLQVVANIAAWLLMCGELDGYQDYTRPPLPSYCEGGRPPYLDDDDLAYDLRRTGQRPDLCPLLRRSVT